MTLRPTLPPALVALAAAAQVALLAPPAAANSFAGLGAFLVAIYFGLPAAVVVLGLLIASIVLLRRDGAPSPGRVLFGRIALWTPLGLVFLEIATALVLERSDPLEGLFAVLAFSLPLFVLTLATVFAAGKLIKRNRPPSSSG